MPFLHKVMELFEGDENDDFYLGKMLKKKKEKLEIYILERKKIKEKKEKWRKEESKKGKKVIN